MPGLDLCREDCFRQGVAGEEKPHNPFRHNELASGRAGTGGSDSATASPSTPRRFVTRPIRTQSSRHNPGLAIRAAARRIPAGGRAESARRRGAALCLLLCLGAGGCLFEPRSAEPPTGGTRTYSPKISPEAVMENLDIALRARDAVGYLDQISSGFRYEPDGQTLSDYPAVDWDNWTRDREAGFINALFNNVSNVESALRTVTVFAEQPTGTEAEWEFIYAVAVTSPGQTTATRYRGRAFFRYALEGSFWYMTEWRDVQGEADPGDGALLPTLGALRGALAGGGG